MTIQRRTSSTPVKRKPSPTSGQRVSKAALPPASRRQLSRNLGKVISFVGSAPARIRPGSLAAQVDFPTFVAGLIDGVFQAIVDASVQQMEAYADLVKDVARSIDAFAKDTISAERARDWLIRKYLELLDDNGDDDNADNESKKKRRPPHRKHRLLTRTEQRALVAAVTLLGIDRLLVKKRPLRPRAGRGSAT